MMENMYRDAVSALKRKTENEDFLRKNLDQAIGEPWGVTELITPAIAADYVATTNINRAINERHVSGYMRVLLAGEFDNNGQGLIFDWNGNLTNGRHRLTAIIRTGVSVKMLVVRGVDPVSIRSLDKARYRTYGQDLAMMDYKNANIIAAITRRLYRICVLGDNALEGGGQVRIMEMELEDHFAADRERIMEAADSVRKVDYWFSPSIGGTLHVLFSRKDHAATLQFFTNLETPSVPTNHPIIHLRKNLHTRKIGGEGKRPETQQLHLGIHAWNLIREKRAGSGLYPRFLRSVESGIIPEIHL